MAIDAIPFRVDKADAFNGCNNPAIYCGRFVWMRDILVASTHVLGAIFMLVSAIYLLLEATMLKTAEFHADGVYSYGHTGWMTVYVGATLYAVSDLFTVVLSVAGFFNAEVRVWWPEGEAKDLSLQAFRLLCNLAVAILAMDLMNWMAPDYTTIDGDTAKSTAASLRTVQWQLFYGVRRFATSREEHASFYGNHLETFDGLIVGLTVVYGVRVAYILVAWLFMHEHPFALWPFACNRNALRDLGGHEEPYVAGVHADTNYIRTPCGSCGGVMSAYMHVHLGSVRNYTHVASILYFIGLIMLVDHRSNSVAGDGFVPWASSVADSSYIKSLGVGEIPELCMFEEHDGMRFDANHREADWIRNDWTECSVYHAHKKPPSSWYTKPEKGESGTDYGKDVTADGWTSEVNSQYPLGPVNPLKGDMYQPPSCRRPSLWVVQAPTLFREHKFSTDTCTNSSSNSMNQVGAPGAHPVGEPFAPTLLTPTTTLTATAGFEALSETWGEAYARLGRTDCGALTDTLSSVSSDEKRQATCRMTELRRRPGLMSSPDHPVAVPAENATTVEGLDPSFPDTDGPFGHGNYPCEFHPARLPHGNHAGALSMYAGLRMNQMSCFDDEEHWDVDALVASGYTLALEGDVSSDFVTAAASVASNKQGWPAPPLKSPLARIPARKCCPSQRSGKTRDSSTTLHDTNDLGQVMFVASVLWLLAALFQLSSAVAFAVALVLYGISPTVSDVPRNEGIFELNPF